jgi:hypothetical protein
VISAVVVCQPALNQVGGVIEQAVFDQNAADFPGGSLGDYVVGVWQLVLLHVSLLLVVLFFKLRGIKAHAFRHL